EHGNGKTDRPASKEVVRTRATVKNAGQTLNHNDKEEEVSVAEYQFPVDASQIMLFARAVGDKNPIYHDAAYARTTEPGGIIAPPTFVQAAAQYDPNFPLRPRIGEPWFGSGREATGVKAKPKTEGEKGGVGQSSRVLHAEQKYEYHKPIRPGDVLTVTTRP